MSRRKRKHPKSTSAPRTTPRPEGEAPREDWARRCQSCGAVPSYPPTGLCGPCLTGEADTAAGDL